MTLLYYEKRVLIRKTFLPEILWNSFSSTQSTRKTNHQKCTTHTVKTERTGKKKRIYLNPKIRQYFYIISHTWHNILKIQTKIQKYYLCKFKHWKFSKSEKEKVLKIKQRKVLDDFLLHPHTDDANVMLHTQTRDLNIRNMYISTCSPLASTAAADLPASHDSHS